MSDFLSQLDSSLKNHEQAKAFATTKQYAVEKRMYDDKGDPSYVWLFAIFLIFGPCSMCFAALVSMIMPGAHWFEIIMWPCVAVSFVLICVGALLPVFKPKAESIKVCLSPNDEPTSAKQIVEIIQSCQTFNATPSQLQQLQEAAQDQQTPAGWWNWLEMGVEDEEWHLIGEQDDCEEIAARKKISEGTVV